MKKVALLANTIRQDIVKMLLESQSGHLAGPLGMADIFAYLYSTELKHKPKKPEWKGRDYLFLSNGHICPVLYATLANVGYFPKKELLTLRKLGSRLQGHPHLGSLPGVENSGGPLGQGASQSCGAAIGFLRNKQKNRVYCVLGDGELNEGQCWEAAMFAGHHELHNLTWLIDRNNIQIDGATDDVMNTRDIGEKFWTFGWHVIRISGHDFDGMKEAFAQAKKMKHKPTVIVAYTIPGRGVPEFENDYHWHGKAPDEKQAARALRALSREVEQ